MGGRLWAMVRKDLARRRRSPFATLVVLSFPLVAALIMTLAFGGGGEAGIPRVQLLVEDLDEGLVGQLILGAFASEGLAERFEVERVGEEGRRRLEEGEASALLILPEGLTRAMVRGEPVTLELVRNPAQGILPEIAEQTAVVLTDLLEGGGRLLRGPLDQVADWTGGEGEPSDAEVARLAVSARRAVREVSDLLLPPVIQLTAVSLGEEETDGGRPRQKGGMRVIFLLVIPGLSVMALFMIGEQSMRDLHTEQEAGTLRRQLAGPVGIGTLVAGKALFTACLATIGLAILAAVGWAAGATGVDLAGFAVLSGALILAVTGFTCAVFGLASSQRQAATLSSILILGMGALGGSFLPLSSLPAALRQAAPFSLFYWATAGYTQLLEGAGLRDLGLNLAVLTGVGLLLLAVGAKLLERRMLKVGR